MKYQVRIKPFVSAGEVFMHGDGRTFEILPLSVFPSGDMTIVRIGRSSYWFQADGTYDGPEFKAKDMGEAQALAISEALGRCKDNRGRAPSDAYFDEGSKGFTNETALWPKKPDLAGPVVAEPLRPPMMFARCCDCGWMLPSTIDVDVDVPSLKIGIVCPRCGKKWDHELKQSVS